MADLLKDRLDEVRVALIHMHKALVDAERVTYQRTVGSIPTPNHFLKLLTDDPWFAWLHPLSQFIVSLDELLEADGPLTTEAFGIAISETRKLLTPSESGQGFGRQYFEALQADPDVIIAHADLMQLLGRNRP